MKTAKDPLPVVYSGPRTIRCTACEWETVKVIPEEVDSMVEAVLEHIQQHGINIPQFLMTVH